MLGQRAERSHRREDVPQELFRILSFHRWHSPPLLLLDQTPYQLIDPGLVVHAHTCAIAARQLRCKFGLHAHAEVRLNH
jgi:hypothetical protein